MSQRLPTPKFIDDVLAAAKACEDFDVTDTFGRDTNYVLPDGACIGMRGDDHRSISVAFEHGLPIGFPDMVGSSAPKMICFMVVCGAVRCRHLDGGRLLTISVGKKITSAQARQIRKAFTGGVEKAYAEWYNSKYERIADEHFDNAEQLIDFFQTHPSTQHE